MIVVVSATGTTARHCGIPARALSLATLIACHGPALPPIPSKGGPMWTELESEHFTLWTDASLNRGHELIRQLEHLRQVVLAIGFGPGEPEGRSLVIAMRDLRCVASTFSSCFARCALSSADARNSKMSSSLRSL